MSGESNSTKGPLKVPSELAVLLVRVDDSKTQLSEGTSYPQDDPLHPVFGRVPSHAPLLQLDGGSPSEEPSSHAPKGPSGRRLATGALTTLGLLLALGMSAVSASSLPAPAPPKESKTLDQRWDTSEVEVVLDSSLSPLGPQIERIIEASFSTWVQTGADLPAVRFVQGNGAVASLEPDGKSTILLAPIQFPGHESDLAITIGFSNPDNGEVSEADIVINAAHVFSSIPEVAVLASGELAGSGYAPSEQESCAGSLDARGCESSYDLQNVMTHEVGHFFGLGENFDDTRATMFSCTSACETHKRDLARADAESIVRLYQAHAEPVAAGCVGVQMGGNTGRAQLGWFTGWVLLLLVALARRRYAIELA